MTPLAVGLAMFAAMLVLMALRVPIAAAMFIPGAAGYWALTNDTALLNLIKGSAVARLTVYDLSVIPLFLLMGQFATQGGLSRALFRAAAAFVGHVRGGLAMAAVLSAGAFGAVCGSSVATSATIAQVAYPEMRRHGYHGRLSTAALAAGGTLGILIPPSVPLVVYAILAEQNIAKLFAAAMIPGIIAMFGYMIAIAIYVRLVPGHAPEHDGDLPHISLKIITGVLPIAIIFLVVFVGIYAGKFTPTEGAAVGAAATFVAALARREITWKGFKICFYATAEASAMIFMIFLGADVMNASLALTQVPNQLAKEVLSWGMAPVAVVSSILLLYVVLGAVMDELSMILLTIPIFFPMVIGLDFGLPKESVAIWFGIMVLMTVGFGMLAPPVGLNVYVVNSMARDVPIAESYRGVMPFLISDTLRTLLLLFFPAISLWLVKYVG